MNLQTMTRAQLSSSLDGSQRVLGRYFGKRDVRSKELLNKHYDRVVAIRGELARRREA